MLTEKQTREVIHLVNQLSADLLVSQGLIVEAIQDSDTIKDNLLNWVKGEVTYATMLDLFAEVF